LGWWAIANRRSLKYLLRDEKRILLRGWFGGFGFYDRMLLQLLSESLG
jgi:hypothetical protein